jgi:tetraacyldisaccharide 4'-kinase
MSGLRGWVPRWWMGEAGLPGAALSTALWPVEQGFRTAVRVRNSLYDRGVLRASRVPVPVISVGNLTVGGSGKTPVAAWLAARLLDRGRTPAIVLRGYGEDEVLLHRELNPGVRVLVTARRRDGALAAAEQGCDVVVLDDAFQHRGLARDLDLVLVPVEGWSVAPRLLPRGPGREPVEALRRAGAVLVTRRAATPEASAAVVGALRTRFPDLPVLSVAILPGGLSRLCWAGEEESPCLRGREVLAVAGLADPRPFAENLDALGARVELAAYADHHPFHGGDARTLKERARGRAIVLTRKDAVKLRPILDPELEAYVLEQEVVVEQPERIDRLLAEAGAGVTA